MPTATFVERLQRLGKERGLPHLAFLSVCDSAVPAKAATAVTVTGAAGSPPDDWREALRGLGQRLVRDVGMKAVVAMTDKISQPTALALGQAFHPALENHGEVDAALAKACIKVGGRADVTTPALFARVAGKRLFTVSSERQPLAESEITEGLRRLPPLFEERAPVLLERQLPDLAARIAAATVTESERRAGVDELERLCEESIELSFAEIARGAAPPRYNRDCPFPGLRAFTKEQRRYYRGREALVATLLERTRGQSFMCVLGNSGSGKSSLVAAGVIPVLEEQQRELVVARMVPGSDPVGNLREARKRHGDAKETLLYIDQFEETFTLCGDRSARKAFLDDVLENRSPDRRVIITMRADFLGECATHPGLRVAVQKQPELVPPMTPEELRASIEAQAKASGLRYETGLTESILPELAKEPGAMPLLQHALAELWQRRHGRWLRRAAWNEEIGGVSGALKKTAEDIWDKLDETSRALLPGIMTSLTRVGGSEGDGPARDTRQRVAMADLYPPGGAEAVRDQVRNLVARLAGEGARRLVTSQDDKTQREMVEVAHEALLRHWPRLVGWINEARDMLRMLQDMRVSAQDWINDGKRTQVRDARSGEEKASSWLEHRGGPAEAVREMMAKGGLVLEERAIPPARGGTGEAGTVKEYFAACERADEEEEKRASAARTRAHLQEEKNRRLQERYVQATMEILSRGIVEGVQAAGGVWGGLDVADDWIKILGHEQPVLAARVLPEGGRLLVGAHDAVLNYSERVDDPSRGNAFLEAALAWLQGLQTQRQILVITNNLCDDWPIDDFFRNLERLQFPHLRDRDLPGQIVNDAALAEVGVLVIGNRWEPDFVEAEHEAIAAFLKRGGGVFAVGLGWSWPGEQNRPLDAYPMNRLMSAHGVQWNGEAVHSLGAAAEDCSAALRIHNQRDEDVDVFWLALDHQEEYYCTVKAGEEITFQTCLAHEWIMKRTADQAPVARTQVAEKDAYFPIT